MILIFLKSPFNHLGAKLDFFTRLGDTTSTPGGWCRNQALRTRGQYTQVLLPGLPFSIALPGWCLFTLPQFRISLLQQGVPGGVSSPTTPRPPCTPPWSRSAAWSSFHHILIMHAAENPPVCFLCRAVASLCSSRPCPNVRQGSLTHLLDVS